MASLSQASHRHGHTKNHDYHLVDPSPWPLFVSLGTLVMAIGAVGFFRFLTGKPFLVFGLDLAGWFPFVLGTAMVLYVLAAWWGDAIREGLKGDHTRVVQLHLRYGMLLFIISEVMFFVGWFWAYFDIALFPDAANQYLRVEATGGTWPPEAVTTFDPWHLPLLNTFILLTSATTLTWAHHALLENNRVGLKQGLLLTILLGITFTFVQGYEYLHAGFGFKDNIYGSVFYMATGFHGFHVIVGTIFLLVCLLRAMRGHFTPQAHFGLEAAAWYWHFVDVVWLFLFVCIYVWGRGA